jgi:hypothetical protein
LDANKISWCNWSLADLGETSAALISGTSGNGGWPTSALKPSGSLIRGYIIAGNTPTGVAQSSALPFNFELQQNYPNPFNPSTNILFTLPSKSFVSLRVFDLLGRGVATLVSEEMSAGSYTKQWNAAALPSGIYFYRLQARQISSRQAGSLTETKKLMLLK